MAELEAVYPDLWNTHGDDLAELDRSLAPRSWTFLFDVAGETGIGPPSMVADVGCGRGNHCFEVARRFGCQVIGIDRILQPLQLAAISAECPSLVKFVRGDIERLPIQAGCIDFVWCRDMLVHVRNLESAFEECYRILRAGGKMLAWVTFETALMEQREAERLYAPLAIEPASVSLQSFEVSFENAGFVVSKSEDLGSELIEFYEERDRRASDELMRIARMGRKRERLIAEWGQTRYDTILALYHWHIYHLLGKLRSGFYLLEKPAARR